MSRFETPEYAAIRDEAERKATISGEKWAVCYSDVDCHLFVVPAGCYVDQQIYVTTAGADQSAL